MLPFTLGELADAVIDGHVTQRMHPWLPLSIFNYSPSVQYENRWNDVTLNCRGLILDDNGNVVARPWKKFFNLGQVNLPIQFDTPVEVMDKVDGSLGILYHERPGIKGGYSISTRGSFESEQAQHATFVWKARYEELVDVPDDYTFLFEIVYPANRIVLDYGDRDDLVLLGAVSKDNGYYYGPDVAQAMLNWPGPVVDIMPFNTISDALAHTDRPNAEGYVIRSHNFLVKVKQPDYVDLHRLVTNASPKTVWEQLRAGKSKTEIVSAFPDEFHDYISSMIDPLQEQFDKRLDYLFAEFSRISQEYNKGLTEYDVEFDRGKYARFIKNHPDKGYFFTMLDDRPIRDALWSELKPKMEVPNA